MEQMLSRMSEGTDFYLLQENVKYVQYESIAQMSIAIIAAIIQVYFIRKLFSSSSIKKKFQQKA